MYRFFALALVTLLLVGEPHPSGPSILPAGSVPAILHSPDDISPLIIDATWTRQILPSRAGSVVEIQFCQVQQPAVTVWLEFQLQSQHGFIRYGDTVRLTGRQQRVTLHLHSHPEQLVVDPQQQVVYSRSRLVPALKPCASGGPEQVERGADPSSLYPTSFDDLLKMLATADSRLNGLRSWARKFAP